MDELPTPQYFERSSSENTGESHVMNSLSGGLHRKHGPKAPELYEASIQDIKESIELIELMEDQELVTVTEQLKRIEDECYRIMNEMAIARKSQQLHAQLLIKNFTKAEEDISIVQVDDIQYIFQSVVESEGAAPRTQAAVIAYKAATQQLEEAKSRLEETNKHLQTTLSNNLELRQAVQKLKAEVSNGYLNSNLTTATKFSES